MAFWTSATVLDGISAEVSSWTTPPRSYNVSSISEDRMLYVSLTCVDGQCAIFQSAYDESDVLLSDTQIRDDTVASLSEFATEKGWK